MPFPLGYGIGPVKWIDVHPGPFAIREEVATERAPTHLHVSYWQQPYPRPRAASEWTGSERREMPMVKRKA